MKIHIPESVLSIYHYLIDHQYEAYFVGGCVRDGYLNIECADYDITTNALVHEMIDLFTDSCFKLILTGVKHGTITVINQSMHVEVTTYRSNEVYNNHRTPTSLNFTSSLHEDLKRRDFTMNALAYNLTDILDEHQGIEDINNKIVRCIGDANLRFNEDALRILRAIRFAHRYQFILEHQTKLACFHSFPLLKSISIERVRDEFFKMLIDQQPNLIDYLNQFPFFETFIPEIKQPKELNDVPSRLDFKLASLLKGTNSTSILRRLKCDNKLIKQVSRLLQYQDHQFSLDRVELRLFALQVDNHLTFMEDLFIYTKQEDILELLHLMIQENDFYSIGQLAINGNDCIELGLVGNKISQALKSCLILVIHDPSKNNKEELIKYIKDGQ